MLFRTVLCALLALPALAFAAEDRFRPAEVDRLVEVGEPDLSPDGRFLLYSTTANDLAADKQRSDIWRVGWDGSDRRRLTVTGDASEWQPTFSPDGRQIAFLADRGGEDAVTQVWVMPADGGEARKVTDLPDGVEDYVWSPDGKRLAVIAWDPERPAGTPKPKNPPVIVTDRYQFKDDETGYLTARRKHLYVVDVATGVATQLTSGAHDEAVPSWAPDGRTIAYVTKRGEDPDRHANFDIWLIAPQAGAKERQLTTSPGSDLDPYWESRPEWSPDGNRIAYLQGGEEKWIYYAPWQVAVIEVATGAAKVTAPLDNFFYKPRWSPDGKSVLALVEQSRVTHLARIDAASGKVAWLDGGKRFDTDFAISPTGRVAVLGGDDHHPYEIAAVETKGLRPLTAHNDWLAAKALAGVEDISFKSRDGTEIEGFLVKPPDWQPGKRYPTILRIHGGPVYQYSHEFMYDWQAYAAAGYVVVAANPRGSSGRGFDFARAIYADWGAKDAEDVLAAADYAVAIGVADPERLGVGGWSYGGILTDTVIARDHRFKAAISGAGSANMLGIWGSDQYSQIYEIELGLPWAAPEAYQRTSYAFLNAEKITTPTMFQCAEKDFNVPCIGAEQMYQALRTRGVPTTLVIYPGEHHALKVPSYFKDRIERNIAWYDKWLKPAGR